jgi:hypothetical protein
MVREKITGYPTLLVYKNGDRLGEYRGDREERQYTIISPQIAQVMIYLILFIG